MRFIEWYFSNINRQVKSITLAHPKTIFIMVKLKCHQHDIIVEIQNKKNKPLDWIMAEPAAAHWWWVSNRIKEHIKLFCFWCRLCSVCVLRMLDNYLFILYHSINWTNDFWIFFLLLHADSRFDFTLYKDQCMATRSATVYMFYILVVKLSFPRFFL